MNKRIEKSKMAVAWSDVASVRRIDTYLFKDIAVGDQVFIDGVYREVEKKLWINKECIELTFKALI